MQLRLLSEARYPGWKDRYKAIVAGPPIIFDGTSLEYARQFEPGSREVTIYYGLIPMYRDTSRPSWGFAISDESATDHWYGKYTAGHREAKKIFAKLKQNAEERGFRVRLLVDPESYFSEADFV